MDAKLLSCGKFEIPEALAFDHEALCAELSRAAMEPGPIGKAAERAALLCRMHFAAEEEIVFRAFGLLHDLAAGRVRPDMDPVAPLIARFTAQHLGLRDYHQSISVAIEELLQEARKDGNQEIAELVDNLRNHERIENLVMYPTMLFIDSSVRESLRA
ncbi:MAG: hypothetical protein HYU75_21215 [Betaproteobacteria bacterium]|nr:hypothetical protein [Betaproteobacteria bacterium]